MSITMFVSMFTEIKKCDIIYAPIVMEVGYENI